MREIKFRAWDKENKMIVDWHMGEFRKKNKGFTWDFVYERPERFDLMQYTGLLDKNGKEIYEGDIIETENSVTKQKYRNKIVFQGGAFRLQSGGMYWMDWEIIGNIYENTDLLTPTHEK